MQAIFQADFWTPIFLFAGRTLKTRVNILAGSVIFTRARVTQKRHSGIWRWPGTWRLKRIHQNRRIKIPNPKPVNPKIKNFYYETTKVRNHEKDHKLSAVICTSCVICRPSSQTAFGHPSAPWFPPRPLYAGMLGGLEAGMLLSACSCQPPSNPRTLFFYPRTEKELPWMISRFREKIPVFRVISTWRNRTCNGSVS